MSAMSRRPSSRRIPPLVLLLALFIGLSGLCALLLHMRLDSQHGREATRSLRSATVGGAVAVGMNGTMTNEQYLHHPKERSYQRYTVTGTTAEVPVVAYAVTITKCGKKKTLKSPWTADSTVYDSAAVFQHSVRLVSHPWNPSARYGAKFYALVARSDVVRDAPCVTIIEKLGFEIIYEHIPVGKPLFHILREYPNKPDKKARPWIKDDGCCGETELLKLRMFELVKHPVVVHLDLDTMLLRPLDELFDVIVHPPRTHRGATARDHLVRENLIAPTYEGNVTKTVDAFYTRDWTSTWPGRGKVGVQGGFFVARPSLRVYDDLKRIIAKGDYILGQCKTCGWGGLGYGRQIEGSMTFQGITAYYYDIVSTAGVEVHMCKFNMMASNPRRTKGNGRKSKYHRYPQPTPLDPDVAGYRDKECRDGRTDCEDVQCQTWPLDDVRSLHFNFCLKPWICPGPKIGTKVEGTCRAMHREWFKVRRELEGERDVDGTYLPDTFLSYCRNSSAEGYIPIMNTHYEFKLQLMI